MTNNDVIDTLKQAGFRVRVQHFRRYRLGRGKKAKLAPKTSMIAGLFEPEANGGLTRCLLLETTRGMWRGRLVLPGEDMNQEGLVPIAGRWSEGVARCATDDPFNKSQGVRFALRDALLNINMPDYPHHTLIEHCIEQLEQVENEYQEDVRLRAEASAVHHRNDEAIWGDLRRESQRLSGYTPGKRHGFPLLERAKRKEMFDAVRAQILAAAAGEPLAIETHAY